MMLPGRGRPTVIFTIWVMAPVNDNPIITVQCHIFISQKQNKYTNISIPPSVARLGTYLSRVC